MAITIPKLLERVSRQDMDVTKPMTSFRQDIGLAKPYGAALVAQNNQVLVAKKENTNEKDIKSMIKSRGIGDTIEKIMKATGVKNLVETVSGAIGIEDCGCEARKDALNKMFPYKKQQ
jgi:hypothetical protein